MSDEPASDPGGATGEAVSGEGTRQWLLVGLGLAVLWLFIRGVRPAPGSILAESLLGLLVGLPVAYFFRRLYVGRTSVRQLVRATPAIVGYLLRFVRDLVSANLDVAYRVLAPAMPLEPGVLVVRLRVQSPAAITTIANSITLTPGTLTLDYDENRNALYVHAIDVTDPDGVAEPIRRWEEYAAVIFDEDVRGPPRAIDVATREGSRRE